MNRNIGSSEKAIVIDVTGGDQAIPSGTRGLYVGTGGNVVVTMQGGGNITFTGVPAGAILPIGISAVIQTGTTALTIVALL